MIRCRHFFCMFVYSKVNKHYSYNSSTVSLADSALAATTNVDRYNALLQSSRFCLPLS